MEVPSGAGAAPERMLGDRRPEITLDDIDRHAVSDLGRILVRDVGKLPQMLAQHRREIVAEIRGAAAFAPPAARAGESVGPDDVSRPVPEPALAESEPHSSGEADAAAADVDSELPPDDDGAGRRWRGRRRQSD